MSDIVTVSTDELDTIKTQLVKALQRIEALEIRANTLGQGTKELALNSFFAKLDEMSTTANLSEEEATKVAEEAAQWVRAH